MKRKVLNTVIASAAILGGSFSGTIANAATGSQVVNFAESTGQAKSKTITIPKLYKVNSVTTDNGDVTYTVKGNNITIEVDNGDYSNREAYTDPKMYQKDVTKTVSQTTDTGGNSFASTASYSDGSGYSGTLSKSGSSTRTSLVKYPNYATDKLIAVDDQYQTPDWNPTTEGAWTRTGVVGDMTHVRSVWYYEVNRYSQGYYVKSTSRAATAAANWINAGGTIDAPKGDTYDWWDFYNNHNGDSYFAWDYTGPGNLGAKSDLVDTFITTWSWAKWVSTYEQNYAGTVYKSGTKYRNYTYEYNVTVNYETDVTAPTGNVTADVTTPTTGNVVLTATATDSQSGVKRIKLPNGTYVSSSTATYTATKNGSYKFDFEDKFGNISSKTYDVTNIDREDPTGTFTPNILPWTNQTVSVVFKPSDSGSGVKQWRYRTSKDSGATFGAWSSYITGGADGTIPLSSEGRWKVNVQVIDNAGNTNDLTSGNDKTSQIVNFAEGSSRTRTQTITIPGLSKVNSIKANTGDVTYTVNGDKVTITVSNGTYVSREAYTDPNRYPKTVTETVTQNTEDGGNDFASTIEYDKDDYTGTLSKTGSVRASSPTNYPNYESKRLLNVKEANVNTVPSDTITDEGYWVKGKQIGPVMRVGYVWYYSIDRYSAGNYIVNTNDKSLVQTWLDNGGEFSPRGSTYDWWDYYNNHGGSGTFGWDYTGAGADPDRKSVLYPVYIVYWNWTKQVRDYSQDYTGTVYKSGIAYKNYKYAYDVTVDYETSEGTIDIDKTLPSGAFNPNTTSWTNDDINITFNPSDAGGSGVKQWRYRTSSNNGSTYGAWSSYTSGDTSGTIALTSEGQWKIQAEVTDVAGNVNTITSGTHNIDKTAPTATFNPNSASWRNTGLNVSTSFGDTGGSNVKQWRYRTSSDNGSNYGAWSAYTSGGATATIPVSGEGQWKIQVNVLDNAGNSKTVTSGSYNIDMTNPSGTFTPNSSPWTYKDIAVSFDPSDTGGSNVKQWRYRTSSDDGSNYGAWSTYTSGDITSTINLTSSGIWKIEVEVTDNAGNIVTVTSGTYYIDKSVPNVTYNPNTVSWTNKDVSVVVQPYATGKSGIKDWKYRTSSDNGSTWTGWSSLITGNTSKTLTFTNTGKHVIEVQVQTVAGMVNNVNSGIYYIDKVQPEDDIKASITNWTNQNIVLTATGNDAHSGMKQIKLPDGTIKTGGSATYTVTDNGDYTFTFYDVAGNTTTATYTVDTIERVKPFVWYESKTPNTSTSGDVTITIFAGDTDSGVKRIILPNGTSTYSQKTDYKVTDNGTYIFTVEDNAGNTQTYISEVSNIDKNAPTISGLVLYEYDTKKYQVTVDAYDKDGIKSVKLNTGEQLTYNAKTKLYEINNLSIADYTKSAVEVIDKSGNSTGNVSFMTAPSVTFPSGYDTSNVIKDDVDVKINGANKVSFIKNGTELDCSTKPCTYTFTNNGEVIAKHSLDYKAYLKNIKVSNIDKKENNLVLEGDRNKDNKFEVTLNWSLNITNPKVTCESASDLITKNASGQSITLTVLNETYNCYVEGTYEGYPIKSNDLTISQLLDEELKVDRSTLKYESLDTNILMEKGRSGEFYMLNARRSNFDDYSVPIPSSMAQ